MLKSLIGPADPFVVQDERFGRVDVQPGSVLRPEKTPWVVEGERIGRFAAADPERWDTPAGSVEVVRNSAFARRRQHDLEVRGPHHRWRLRQRTWFAATVLRDDQELARLRTRRAPLSRSQEGAGYGVERWVTVPEAVDVGLVHLLAIQAGVGARGFFSDAFELPLLPLELLRARRETLP